MTSAETATGRPDGRAPDELRPVTIEAGFMRSADGSALIAARGTRVICTASLVDGVPSWLEGSGRGWLTAEYGMLPASTGVRRQRDSTRGRPDGRTVEIQRLIGRAFRAVMNLEALGERTVYLDCDVLEADGGTRCAAITGAYVALKLAIDRLVEKGALETMPLRDSVAAVSCGIVAGTPVLDLDYQEDRSAAVDMNVVMTGSEELIEVQATGEGVTFSRAELERLLELAAGGITRLGSHQEEAAGRIRFPHRV
jgi:ribonuclease PH